MNIVFEISMVVFVLAFILFGRSILRLQYTKMNTDVQYKLTTIKVNHEEVFKHLDFLIDTAIDRYVMINIIPTSPHYISSSAETKLIEYLEDIVPARISISLYRKLTIIYNEDTLGTIIGERIHDKVLNYVLDYNVANEQKK